MKRGTAIVLALGGTLAVGGGITALVMANRKKPATAKKKNDQIQLPKDDKPPADPDLGLTTYDGGLKGQLVEINVAKDAVAPLLVVLHGRDADQTQLAPLVGNVPARILFLRGGKKGPKGYRYFDPFFTDNNGLLAAGIEAGTDQVTAAIVQVENSLQSRGVYNGTAVIGYDQGAAIAYLLAAREIGGELESSYLAIAGMLPPILYPTADDPQRWTNVKLGAVHGVNDKKVTLKEAHATMDAFTKLGPPKLSLAEFVEVKDGDHELATLLATAKAVIED